MFCYKLCLMNVYKYFILIKFSPNHMTCFHKIFANFHVNTLKTYNINTNSDIKIGQIKHWLHL